MRADNQPLIIEISEEAYKQNTVYRPWQDIKNRQLEPSMEQPEARNGPVTAHWSLAEGQSTGR